VVKKSQKVLDFIDDMLRTLLSYGITVYMLLLIVVLPLYFEQGYGYIATDKASFFCKVSVNVGKVLFPIIILRAIAAIAINHAKIRSFFQNKQFKMVLKAYICRISALDFFVGLYGASVLLSYLCSNYRDAALWGTAGWYMGFVPQMILVCGYFLIAKFWEPKKWVFYMTLPVAIVVFALGYLNRFGYYPIEMEYANPSFISTIGNINWYCSYVVPVLFVWVGLFWSMSKVEMPKRKAGQGTRMEVLRWYPENIVVGAFICLGFATLITQGSASGILTLTGMMIVLFYISANRTERMRKFWIVALLFSASCVMTMLVRDWFPEGITYHDRTVDVLTSGWGPILMTLVSLAGFALILWNSRRENSNIKIIRITAILCVTLVSCIVVVYVLLLTVNTLHPGALGKLSEYSIFTFSDKWGSSRGATWKIGALCFGEQNFLHKLVGVGPDSMWTYIDTDGSETLVQLMEKNFGTKLMLTNAHNEWLTILVNYGILGLISFVGMIVSAVRSFFSQKNTGKEHILVACAFGILAHTINNIFSFQQVVNMTVLFLLLGMGRAFTREA